MGDVSNGERRHADPERNLLRELGAILDLYFDRLMPGLELMARISGAMLTEEVHRTQRDVEVLLAAMQAL
mgnify:CR=1 FL=1